MKRSQNLLRQTLFADPFPEPRTVPDPFIVRRPATSSLAREAFAGPRRAPPVGEVRADDARERVAPEQPVAHREEREDEGVEGGVAGREEVEAELHPGAVVALVVRELHERDHLGERVGRRVALRRRRGRRHRGEDPPQVTWCAARERTCRTASAVVHRHA